VNTFENFYSRQRQKFFAYLMRFTGDYPLACDVMQESFARLYEKYAAENYKPQLLYTIGRNLVLDALRSRNRNKFDSISEQEAADEQEHYLMVRDEYRRVLVGMQKLEADERDLLALVVSSELSYRELAEITGISEGNVKVKIHRARKKLRNYLGAEKT
jgi:RNA polymerase sigma-70 factor (ECF subfamily)